MLDFLTRKVGTRYLVLLDDKCRMEGLFMETTNNAPGKSSAAVRHVQGQKKSGLTVQDLIIIAVLLAAGAVLKLTVASFLSFAGMKPNFIIAMYCLAIILVRPNVGQAIVIGLIAGLMCQLPMLNATPWINIASETIGAFVCGLLIHVPMRIGHKMDLNPLVSTFLSTVVSGYTFAIIVGVALNGLSLPVTIATYAVMVFGTAALNCVLVAILTMPLRKVLKRQAYGAESVGKVKGGQEVRNVAAADAGEGEAAGEGEGAAAVASVPASANTPAPATANVPTAASAPADADATASANVPSPATANAAIVLEDFGFRYQESAEPTVQDINITIPVGAFVGITGAAGSGKSTLTYAFNGIIPNCYPGDLYGHARVCGLDTTAASLTDISQKVGSVCQDIDSQMVSSVVEDEILYGMENFGIPKDQVEHRLTEALDAMGIADLRERTIDSLSGGQKQKVAIASVIALKPEVLVLDEPTAELDPASSVAVFDLLKKYAQESGTTVIVVEQKIALLSSHADLLLIMEGGRIRFAGTPAEVLAHSNELLAIGVNCSRSTSLVNRLIGRGLYAGSTARSVEEAVSICREVLA